MSVRRSSEQCPGRLFIMNPQRFVNGRANGLRLLRYVGVAFTGLALLLLSGNSYGAEVVPYCEARKYRPCPSFRASVTIGHQVEIIDNAFSGYTRSKGSWTIDLQYRPAESCAIVKILLDTGPVDFPRSYERTFTGGGGQFIDGGSFIHRTDDPDSALNILTSSCFMPADTSASANDQASHSGDQGQATKLDDLLERLAVRERGSANPLDEQLERLASEEQQLQQAARARQAALEAEQEQERLRLAKEQEFMEQAYQEFLDALERRKERERQLEQQRVERERQRRQENDQAATADLMTGLALGLLGGVLGMLAEEGGGSINPGALAVLPTGGGTGCEMIGQRLARELQTLNQLHGNSMCGMGRGMAQALTRARNDLAARNCASGQELADMDRSIREAQATARASCGNN